MSASEQTSRDREIYEARLRGETIAELSARFGLHRERITQACVREQAKAQRHADEETSNG